MEKYSIAVTETVRRVYEIEAGSLEEAEDMVTNAYNAGKLSRKVKAEVINVRMDDADFADCDTSADLD